MAKLAQFATPANQSDLAGADQKRLNADWSASLARATQRAILGDPWLSKFDQNRDFYYDPLQTDLAGGTSATISWTAFPNRILVQFPAATPTDQFGFAEGVHADGTFGPPPDVGGQPYQPQGPRGWQDEYCEWIATRDASGKITRVDFTCENPEYWFTLWHTDPNKVLSLYQQLVDPSVKIDDLFLRDSNGNPVIDRSTGLPAYDPANKFNSQPSAGQITGAVHLISPPNTLGAEIYLAAAATILRERAGVPVTNPDDLLNCSQYGTAGRNSDPHIGASVNAIVAAGGTVVSLQDPVGLYIQTPDFSGYTLPNDPKLPKDADVSECWQVLRGTKKSGGSSVDLILHARFEIPQRWKKAGVAFTVGDIQINGNPIQFGAQITQTFTVALRGFALATTKPNQTPQRCRADATKSVPAPQLVQDMNLFQAGTTSSAVPLVEQGSTVTQIAVLALRATSKTKITFTGGSGVTATVTGFQNIPGVGQLFTVTVKATSAAALGDRALQLTSPTGAKGPALPGAISIVPPGTLGKHVASAVVKATASAATLPVAAKGKQTAKEDRAERARAATKRMQMLNRY